jgi:hypothetical protein
MGVAWYGLLRLFGWPITPLSFGFQFSYLPILLFAAGLAAVLRGAAGVEELGADLVELRVLRVVESLVYALDAGVDDHRLLVWEDDYGAGGE